MRDKLKEHIGTIADQPHGMLIVCGPTGAGKSTTLYACLSEIDRFQKNVITVENPVEYHIENFMIFTVVVGRFNPYVLPVRVLLPSFFEFLFLGGEAANDFFRSGSLGL